MYNAKGTIETALREVQAKRWVLPAIQREFVWKPEQICRLFDSLLRGYPFGTFLFWRVPATQSANYRFYDFVRDYHERDAPHCPDHPVLHSQQLLAVLDGQQRLTALNIGLFGSMAVKDGYRWRNNPNAYPRRILCLDLLGTPDEDEQEGDESGYHFSFRKEEEAGSKVDGRLWFPVPKIMGMKDGPEMLKYLTGHGLAGDDLNTAYSRLDRLYRAVRTDQLVFGYEEAEADLPRVLSIFIRMNSGGTTLSYSDLLLSIAVAQWSKLDARREIHGLVDDLNRIGSGFSLTHDFVLKAGLMLAEIAGVGFKVENFTRENMAKLEDGWTGIRQAVITTVQLAASFGLNDRTLKAESALLPLAYHMHRRGAGANFVDAPVHAPEREAIRGWLVRSLLKPSGIWGSGLDTLLTALRDTMSSTPAGSAFPVSALSQTMATRGKSLTFNAEEIEELLDIQYGDRNQRAFLLLSLLYPFVDLRNLFHVDHIFPRSGFYKNKLKAQGFDSADIAELQDRCERLPNLQLLEGAQNVSKNAVPPHEWLNASIVDDKGRVAYLQRHDLGELPDSLKGFGVFYDSRRNLMKRRIADLLGTVATTPST